MSSVHVVRRGECLSQIAFQHGFRDYRALYDHPDNAALRKKRPNPNVLFPGDEIAIPTHECYAAKVPVGRSHTFVARMPSKVLRLRLLASDGRPLTDADYAIEVDGVVVEGNKTDRDGYLEHAIPLHVRHAVVRVDGCEVMLGLGGLNPIRDTPDHGVSGIQARLRNLGYDPGPVDGHVGRRTRGALTLFQADAGIPITGRLDDVTAARLEELHGC